MDYGEKQKTCGIKFSLRITTSDNSRKVQQPLHKTTIEQTHSEPEGR